jgi:hypothetical protein
VSSINVCNKEVKALPPIIFSMTNLSSQPSQDQYYQRRLAKWALFLQDFEIGKH